MDSTKKAIIANAINTKVLFNNLANGLVFFEVAIIAKTTPTAAKTMQAMLMI